MYNITDSTKNGFDRQGVPTAPEITWVHEVPSGRMNGVVTESCLCYNIT